MRTASRSSVRPSWMKTEARFIECARGASAPSIHSLPRLEAARGSPRRLARLGPLSRRVQSAPGIERQAGLQLINPGPQPAARRGREADPRPLLLPTTAAAAAFPLSFLSNRHRHSRYSTRPCARSPSLARANLEVSRRTSFPFFPSRGSTRAGPVADSPASLLPPRCARATASPFDLRRPTARPL